MARAGFSYPPVARGPGAVLLLAFLGAAAAFSALAADAAPEIVGGEPEWLGMAFRLLGGLALFLFGMDQMAENLKAAAGHQMKLLLAKLTTNRIAAACTGAAVTAIIQSSSVTTVLVVGFVSAGLMTLPQSIGIIMGANVGTTITAQIVAFNVTEAALPMIALGFALLFFSRDERAKQTGGMIMGLGLVFYGMSAMGDAMAPLRDYPPFLELMQRMESPFSGIVVAALFTALVQSSSATTGIVIVMASQGFITLPTGIAMALGANIGTCITALLASIGKTREAMRAAAVHVLFNIAGVVLWLGFIGTLAELSVLISPVAETLNGMAKLAYETPRQIANANTIFNLANTLLFLGLTGPIAALAERLIPEKPAEPEKLLIQPKFLDEELLGTPALALDRVRFEAGHMGDHVKSMLEGIGPALIQRDQAALKRIRKTDDKVDLLRDHVATYLSRLGKAPLTDAESRDFVMLMSNTEDIEAVGDVIETDLVTLGNRLIEQNISPSETTRQIMAELYGAITKAFGESLTAVQNNDQRAAQEVIGHKDEINRLVERALQHQAKRLVADEADRLTHHRVEMEVIDKLKRIYTLSKRIARRVLPAPVVAEEA